MLTTEQFRDMFFKVAKDFPYENVNSAVKKANEQKGYLARLHSRCRLVAHRNCIDEHDALYILMGRGKVC